MASETRSIVHIQRALQRASWHRVDQCGESTESSAKALARTLQCPLCEQLLRDPVELRCMHNFCSDCIKRHEEEGGHYCPECNELFWVNEITHNHTLAASKTVEGLRCSDVRFRALQARMS